MTTHQPCDSLTLIFSLTPSLSIKVLNGDSQALIGYRPDELDAWENWQQNLVHADDMSLIADLSKAQKTTPYSFHLRLRHGISQRIEIFKATLCAHQGHNELSLRLQNVKSLFEP